MTQPVPLTSSAQRCPTLRNVCCRRSVRNWGTVVGTESTLVYPASLALRPLGARADRELNQLIDDFDVVTSGTYRSLRPGGRLVAQGTVIRNGKLETLGHRKTWKRGGVAVLQDGTIVVDRMAGGTLSDIQHRFGQPDNPVVQFLGGGAVMVENGKKIQSTDVHGRQEFQRRQGSGLNAPEMAVDNHVTVGIRAGMCVATAMNRSGRVL